MRPKTTAGKFLWYVLPLLCWMGLIFFLSTDNGSVAHTNPAMSSIVRRLFPGIEQRLGPEITERIDWNIRKTAHVSEYALLAILSFRAIAWGNPRLRGRNILLPYLIGLLYAASDEYHQSFVPSRGASAADVFFDQTGVLIGVVVCLWQHIIRNQKTS